MILTKNSNGEWIQVAGNGKAEYGASTERKGDITVPATTAGNFQTVNVVFAQAMPDNDYTVVIDEGLNTWAHCTINVTNKTATGFTLFFLNLAGQDTPQMTFKYRVFKLYTDTEYNSLLDLPDKIEAVEDDVEAMKSETSGSATIASGLLGQVTWTKIGRLVQVRVNNIRNDSGAIAGGATICTGLPVAKSTTSFAIGRYPNEANAVDLISNGELRQTGMYSVAGGIGMFGDFMYISAQ